MLVVAVQACQVESDSAAVSAYILFLAQHTSQFDIHDLDALALVGIVITVPVCYCLPVTLCLQVIELTKFSSFPL